MDDLVKAIHDRYGVGMWTIQQILGELPKEVFPARTQWVMYTRGASVSLGHHLAKDGRFTRVANIHGGRVLYRLKHDFAILDS